MARYLETHIGALFGEDARVEMALFADALDSNIDVIEKNLRRHIDGIRLFDVVEDDFGSSVRLSPDARRYFHLQFFTVVISTKNRLSSTLL